MGLQRLGHGDGPSLSIIRFSARDRQLCGVEGGARGPDPNFRSGAALVGERGSGGESEKTRGDDRVIGSLVFFRHGDGIALELATVPYSERGSRRSRLGCEYTLRASRD